MPAVDRSPVDYEHQAHNTDDEVRFIRSWDCCVCFVDIVDSTRITSTIDSPEKVRKYYGIFLNTMAAIARNFGAKIIKNAGSCLIFLFPHISSEKSLRDVIESCTTMIEAHDPINDKLHEEDLPILSYRISADYGSVEVARCDGPEPYLFEQTARIISLAPPNGIVIGNGLHDLVQSVSLSSSLKTYYYFKAIGRSEEYPVFSLRRNDPPSKGPNKRWDRNRTHTILLVYNEDVLYTFKTGLISQGFNVEAFTDSFEALTHFATVDPSHYDLAILDIRMPGLNGLQLYYRLKAINRNIKILFVSALDAVPELLSILPNVRKTEDIIKKPSTIENFINAVNAALA